LMTVRKRVEAGLILLAAMTLAACTTSPRSDFAWNLRDTRPHKPRAVAANGPHGVVEYGPRSVALPPVERQLAPPQYGTSPQQQKQSQVATTAPAQKQRKMPGWYTQSQPQQ